MNILIIMGGFFPGKKYGGPPVSVDNFCSLMKDHQCFILTHDHDLGDEKRYDDISEGWNDRGNCKIRYLSDAIYNKHSFERAINEIQPNVIYLQGLFQSCVLPCLQLAKKYSIPVLLAPRGELCEGALNIKKWKKIPYIKTIKLMGLVKSLHWQSTSEEEAEAIKKYMRADANRIHRLENIPSIPRFEYHAKEKKSGEGRFIFLARIHPKKNLIKALQFFHDINGKAVFDIYGSIEDAEYWKQCEEEIKALPSNVKVEYRGLINHDEVHRAFSQYDAFIFPTLSENYGHVIAESLFAGTPVIISDQTPWTDVNNAGAGGAFHLTDRASFVKLINSIIMFDNDEMENMRKNSVSFIRSRVHIDEIKGEYEKALNEVLKC